MLMSIYTLLMNVEQGVEKNSVLLMKNSFEKKRTKKSFQFVDNNMA